jgi:hypothetical protein
MGMGMSEFDRAQFMMASTRVVKKPCPLLPLDPAMKLQTGWGTKRTAMSHAGRVERFA